MDPRKTSRFAHDLAATLTGRYGSKALEALLYIVAMRTIGGRAVGLVFVAQAASALAFRLLDLGLHPVIVRGTARRQIDAVTYGEILRKRAIGVAVFSAAFMAYSYATTPEHTGMLLGLFVANGLVVLHELPRAVLAGQEHFRALAKLNLASKAFEVGVAIAGMLLGVGLLAWMVARLVAHVAFLFVSMRLAHEVLAERPRSGEAPASEGALVRSGFVFWLTRLCDVASVRLALLVVTSTAGLVGATQLGLASKLHIAAVGLLGTVTQVAFPRLARDDARRIAPRTISILLAASTAIGGLVYLVAPFYVRVLVGRWDADMIALVQAMAPVLALSAVSRPLEMWLEAKDHERYVLAIAVLSLGVLVPATWQLVGLWGVVGAGWARVLQALAETVTTLFGVAIVSRRHARIAHT